MPLKLKSRGLPRVLVGPNFTGAGCGGGRGGCEAVEDGAAGVAEGEELGDFVVGFAGGVVAGLADFFVGEGGSAVGS